MSKLSCSIPVRVYIEDTDAGGIVYYVNYLKFMERARTEFMRNLGYGKAAFFADKLMFVVHSLEVKYVLPAQLDDLLSVSATVIKKGRAGLLFEQKIMRGDELLCSGTVKIACVDRAHGKPAAIPDELFAQLT